FPKGSRIMYLEGANHAQFGDYGFQKGDKYANISSEDQKRITADIIIDFISKTY
ncbi:MAG: alpha/beta hydrolase, partial [Fervidobacterium sp.]